MTAPPPVAINDTTQRRITRAPLWLTVALSAFVAVLVPVYWRTYGPANFLWFCDVALLLTAVGLWIRSRLLLSMQFLAMALPQSIWIVDFLTKGRLLGLSTYMFNPVIPMLARTLSSFHIWLPFLLFWCVWRFGYDRRALAWQSLVAACVLIASYLLTDPAQAPTQIANVAVNVNRVYGPLPTQVQHWMPGWVYLLINVVLGPLLIYVPSHLLFRRVLSETGRG